MCKCPSLRVKLSTAERQSHRHVPGTSYSGLFFPGKQFWATEWRPRFPGCCADKLQWWWRQGVWQNLINHFKLNPTFHSNTAKKKANFYKWILSLKTTGILTILLSQKHAWFLLGTHAVFLSLKIAFFWLLGIWKMLFCLFSLLGSISEPYNWKLRGSFFFQWIGLLF